MTLDKNMEKEYHGRFRHTARYEELKALVGVVPAAREPFTIGDSAMLENLSGKVIAAVAGDIGGYRAVEPVLSKAVDAGATVRLCLAGKSAEAHAKGGFLKDERFQVMVIDATTLASDLIQFGNGSSILVAAVSQSAEGAMAVESVVLMITAPIVVVEDLYGSCIPVLRKIDASAGPSRREVDSVCVADRYAKQHLLNVIPELNGRVVVTGGPQFDQVPNMKETWDEQADRVLALLPKDAIPIVVAGQLNGTDEMLRMIRDAFWSVKLLWERLAVILRTHPRATDEDKNTTAGVVEELKAAGLTFVDVPREIAATSEHLLPAVGKGRGLVLSGYSTTLQYGIFLEIPGVCYMLTPSLLADLKREKGLDMPPDAAAHLGWCIREPRDLRHVITAVQLGSMELHDLRERQHEVAQYCDGHAADRVLAEIAKVV